MACSGNDYDLHKVLTLDVPLVEMDALSLNYWMTKFVQEVTRPPKPGEISSKDALSDCVRLTSLPE